MATVLITGTSTGIGFATALAFGRAGYKVAATMRSPTRAPELANTAAREKLAITVFTMDVDSDASVKEAIPRIVKEMGPIDVLVNNAGIERTGSVEELPLAECRALMETNYFGVIRCVQAVVPAMRERRNGCIINVASVAGHISLSPLGAYAATKFALEALSEALAQEVRSFNIHVAIVEPGIIDTADGSAHRRRRGALALPPPASQCGPFRCRLEEPGTALPGCREGARDRRQRYLEAPASGRAGR
jgi:NAD(P)-dependent dehydrogenase (short-subunit alcohol dehydrogenase family)